MPLENPMSDPYEPHFPHQPAPRPPKPVRLAPPPGALDTDAALERYLAHLDTAIEWCFDRDRYDRGASAAIGARLIKASLDVRTARNEGSERRFTYRCIVEHVAAPLPPEENLKTIHGVARPAGPPDVAPQDGAAQDGAAQPGAREG
jgi:hypothetical protein